MNRVISQDVKHLNFKRKIKLFYFLISCELHSVKLNDCDMTDSIFVIEWEKLIWQIIYLLRYFILLFILVGRVRINPIIPSKTLTTVYVCSYLNKYLYYSLRVIHQFHDTKDIRGGNLPILRVTPERSLLIKGASTSVRACKHPINFCLTSDCLNQPR